MLANLLEIAGVKPTQYSKDIPRASKDYIIGIPFGGKGCVNMHRSNMFLD